jgi:hypothetical protein
MATAKTCFLIGPMRGDVQMERQRRLAEIVKEALGELQHDEFDVRTRSFTKVAISFSRLSGRSIEQTS